MRINDQILGCCAGYGFTTVVSSRKDLAQDGFYQ